MFRLVTSLLQQANKKLTRILTTCHVIERPRREANLERPDYDQIRDFLRELRVPLGGGVVVAPLFQPDDLLFVRHVTDVRRTLRSVTNRPPPRRPGCLLA